MAIQELAEPLMSGTFVNVIGSNFHRAQIAEYSGPLGPKGARVYRVLVIKRPRMYIEVLEEELEVLEDQKTKLPRD